MWCSCSPSDQRINFHTTSSSFAFPSAPSSPGGQPKNVSKWVTGNGKTCAAKPSSWPCFLQVTPSFWHLALALSLIYRSIAPVALLRRSQCRIHRCFLVPFSPQRSRIKSPVGQKEEKQRCLLKLQELVLNPDAFWTWKALWGRTELRKAVKAHWEGNASLELWDYPLKWGQKAVCWRQPRASEMGNITHSSLAGDLCRHDFPAVYNPLPARTTIPKLQLRWL